MKTQSMIDTMTTKVKAVLQNHVDQLDKPLTVESAEKAIEIIGQATVQAATEGLKTYLEAGERTENSIVHNGETYRFNRNTDKEFQTTFGKIVLKRRLYQNENGEDRASASLKPRAASIRRRRTEMRSSDRSRLTAKFPKAKKHRFGCKAAPLRGCRKTSR